MSLAILSWGTALPSTVITQAEAVRLTRIICRPSAEQAEQLPHFYRQTEIDKRHLSFSRESIRDVIEGTWESGSAFVPRLPDDPGPTTRQRMQHYAQEAGPLAVRAAAPALKQSGLAPRDLTHLITVCCTGFSAPGVDLALIQDLDLAPTIERTHVGFMGCHGALNALRVARAFAGSNPHTRVLVCAVELCGLHFHYGWDPKKMIANALFADGAAAVIGVPAEAAPADAWQVAASGSCLFPDTASAMTWNIGDHGFEMSLSIRVPNLIGRHLRPRIESWLAGQGLRLDDIASWAVHPGGPGIVSAVVQALRLDEPAVAVSRAVLAAHGNMSSPTILFILDELRRRRAPRPCVALAFGPGLVAEFTLWR